MPLLLLLFSSKVVNSFLTKQLLLILSRRRPLSYRNQSIDLQSKSMDWFLYDNGLRLKRVNSLENSHQSTNE